MRNVLPLITARQARYQEHPFIQFLLNSAIPAELRLSYTPFTCHFVMTFAEINRRFLTDEDSSDALQDMVNTHAAEDARHWSWFLSDLRILGYDETCSLADAMRFLWGDAGWHTREMGYYAASVARNADPGLRLVIIEALESMGKIWLESTVCAAREHPRADELIYFGQHHMDRETGHAIGSEHDAVLDVVLPPAQIEYAREVVNGLFDRMESMNTEILARALHKQETGAGPLLAPASH